LILVSRFAENFTAPGEDEDPCSLIWDFSFSPPQMSLFSTSEAQVVVLGMQSIITRWTVVAKDPPLTALSSTGSVVAKPAP
jgi:hypothetical protein